MTSPGATGSPRLDSIDALRGVALLGILLMNITGFGLADAYEVPTSATPGPELWAWAAEMLLVEGTMRGLFTLLFGASVVLYVQGLERAASGAQAAGLYYRRTVWLLLFGLCNAYVLVWSGDILVWYGVAGLFLYAFRNLAPRRLLVCAIPLLCLQTLVGIAVYSAEQDSVARGERAYLLQAQGVALDEAQGADLEAQRERLEAVAARPSERLAKSEAMRAGYASAFRENAAEAWYYQTVFLPKFALCECLGMMLLGMALLRSGALTGEWSVRRYLLMLGAGWSIGLLVNFLEVRHQILSGFSGDAVMSAWLVTYDLGRIPLTLGHLACILLLLKATPGAQAWAALESVGRMALTNYLAHSIIALFLFTGAGLALYGRLQRHELYYVVLAIWLLQLAWSPWWLKRFRYGPMEWLWRSLTRRERQPWRIVSAGSQ
jgi:uncharacterized protein